MKNILIALIALVVLGGGIFYFVVINDSETVTPEETVDTDPAPVGEEDTTTVVIDEEEEEEEEAGPVEVIGSSADGNDITAYHFGDGENEVLFIGGVHGGYSYNTALLGFELVDYLEENSDVIPDTVTATVIPVFNPDGLEEVVGTTGRFDGDAVEGNDTARVPGRFNANNVDLNRNFDCEWQETGTWRNQEVSGGDAPFSEPEAAALRDYVLEHDPVAAVVYYSQAGGVYSATCTGEVSAENAALTNLYAEASNYPAFEEFDYYEITGDMVNWLTTEDVTAISVLLSDHENVEWNRNRTAIEAVLESYSQ